MTSCQHRVFAGVPSALPDDFDSVQAQKLGSWKSLGSWRCAPKTITASICASIVSIESMNPLVYFEDTLVV